MLAEAVSGCAGRTGLVAEHSWVNFALNIHRAARFHRTVFVVGPSGSGKTTALRGLIAGLNRLSQQYNDRGLPQSSASRTALAALEAYA